jgi:PAS domain S-box-containing protein
LESGLQNNESFASSGIPMCLCDRHGKVLERNGAFGVFFHSATPAGAPGEAVDLSGLLEPAFRETFVSALSSAGDGHAGAPYLFQFKYTGRSGQRRSAEANITRLPGRERYLLTFQDVTDKIDAIDELNRRNSDLMSLIKLTKLVSSSLDREKIMKVALAESARIFDMEMGWFFSIGADGASLVSVASHGAGEMPLDAVRRISSLFLENASERFKPVIIDSEGGQPLSGYESEILSLLGLKVLSITPEIIGGNLVGIFCLGSSRQSTGLTAERLPLLLTLTHQMGISLENARLFRELEGSRQQYRLLAENMKEIVFLVDREFVIFYVNRASAEVTGYAREELVGRNLETLFTRSSANRAGVAAVRRLLSGSDVDPLSLELQRKDGGTEMAEVSITRMLDRGELVGLQGVARIITQKLKWEQEIRRHNEEQAMLLDLSRVLSTSPQLEEISLKSEGGVYTSETIQPTPVASMRKVMTDAAERIAAFLGVEAVNVHMRDKQQGGLRQLANYRLEDLPLPRDQKMLEQLPEVPGLWDVLNKDRPTVAEVLDDLPPKFPLKAQLETLGVISFMAAPLLYRGKPLGVISATTLTHRKHFSESEINLFTAISAQIALSIMNALYLDEVSRHKSDLERLSKDLISAQEEERRRIARELHDEAGQALYALRLGLELLRNRLKKMDRETLHMMDEQMKVVSQTIDNIRRITYDLRPSLLDDLGLIPAVRWYVQGYEKRTGINVDLKIDVPELKLPGDAEVNVYRIIQEALTNVQRHAKARNVSVGLLLSAGFLRLEIRDDGMGFTAAMKAGGSGVGLIGMKERITYLGGSLLVYSLRGHGTTLSAEIPIPPGS